MPTPDELREKNERLREEAASRLLTAVGGSERFRRSFDARTHFPERTADRALADAAGLMIGGVIKLREGGLDEQGAEIWQDRFVRLWVAYQQAGARVMNWFITGPAGFPVERNRKRMEIERRRWEEFKAHADGAVAWARRRARSAERAELSARGAEVTHPENSFPGGRLVRNTTLDRVQLIFDAKPSPEIVRELKSRAFRWSPREGAWQRQLTRNGLWAAEAVVKAISASAAS